ncbi:MAG: N-acetylmuramoyl-L-alanine amidase [Bryobacteraceae bacterium]
MGEPLLRQQRVSGLIAGAACVLALIPSAARPAELLEVKAVRFWTLGETTRIAIEVSGEFQFKHDRLFEPDRLYFDILGAKPGFTRQKVHTFPVGDKLLKQIRVSETQRGVTRVVLDLEQAADFSAAQLANPDRLVVELRRRGKPPEPTSGPPPPAQAPKPQAAVPVQTPAAPEPIAEAKAEPARPQDERIALPAKKSAIGNRSLVRALGLKLQRVVIDPGHGGSDTGTIGPNGLLEKDLVLDVARRLGALIEERLGAEVIYTRTEDVFVPLEERTALANEREADLFLSVHANSGVPSATGSETYYLNFTTSKTAMEVAARENASSQRSIYELQNLIEKIALKDKVDESREFASKVQTSLVRELSRANPASRDRGVRKAPFVVLIGASMPSVLSEIAFLSNPREERLLKREDYRQRIAEGLLKGVSQYASTLSRFQVAEKKGP